jgi:hypothetical protein
MQEISEEVADLELTAYDASVKSLLRLTVLVSHGTKAQNSYRSFVPRGRRR